MMAILMVFILVPQSPPGGWAGSHFTTIADIIDYMIQYNKLDPFQIAANGLSAGGYATWGMGEILPGYVSALLPMSGITEHEAEEDNLDKLKFTPIWDFQGGVDKAPAPATADYVKNAFDAAGARFKYTLYPSLGHGTWSTAWAETDFFPFINRSYSANPWPLHGRTEFCPDDIIDVTIGVAPGFDVYEWRKNGAVIDGATQNIFQATEIGVYDVRLQKENVWSDWSRVPVEIKIKTATVSPTIATPGMSGVIPALDTNSVTMQVPLGYTSYLWQKADGSTVLSTSNTLNVSEPGSYVVKVSEQYGCSSSFSAPFTVVNANGPNKPDAPSGLSATVLSKTSIKLDWNQNPAPQYNETNFEIYQALQPGWPL
ncbi:MAG: hypothetical protein WDN26_00070 [Chitinophagaceae bacterium]